MLRACLRVAGAVMGGVVAFALWLMTVLVRMPRPPVPPSFAATLSAAAVAAVGFALGMRVAERLERRHAAPFWQTFGWAWASGTIGAAVMYPFGGMMAGFGLFGAVIAALCLREVLRRDDGARRTSG
jgi:hypothetical protein